MVGRQRVVEVGDQLDELVEEVVRSGLAAVALERVGRHRVGPGGAAEAEVDPSRVEPGEHLRVEKLAADKGATVTFDNVLLTGGDSVRVGKPFVSGVKVTAQVVSQGKAKKIIVFKMRRRKNYRRKYGHRQPFTELRITGIEG